MRVRFGAHLLCVFVYMNGVSAFCALSMIITIYFFYASPNEMINTQWMVKFLYNNLTHKLQSKSKLNSKTSAQNLRKQKCFEA